MENLTVHSVSEAGEHLEGTRRGLRAVLKLARQRWREYDCEKSGIRIVVKWDGAVIADDPCDFDMGRRKWHMDPYRHGIPQ